MGLYSISIPSIPLHLHIHMIGSAPTCQSLNNVIDLLGHGTFWQTDDKASTFLRLLGSPSYLYTIEINIPSRFLPPCSRSFTRSSRFSSETVPLGWIPNTTLCQVFIPREYLQGFQRVPPHLEIDQCDAVYPRLGRTWLTPMDDHPWGPRKGNPTIFVRTQRLDGFLGDTVFLGL